jgi:hypothetical protein
MSLPQGVLRDKEERLFGTAFYTLGVSLAKIAFKRDIHITMEIDGTERAGDYTLMTGNTLFLINFRISIFNGNRISRTIFPAFWYLTLSTDNGHPDDRMGIHNHHPDTALFRIINPEAVDRADHLAKLTAGTLLRHNRQFPGHKNPPHFLHVNIFKRFYLKYMVCQLI